MFDKNGDIAIGKIIRMGLSVFFLFTMLIGSVNIVSAGFVGVVTRFGAVNRVVYPGISFKIPYFEGLKRMDVREQKSEVDAASASKDLQEVSATVALNFRLDGAYATTVYQDVGVKYQDIIIAPAIPDVLKSTTALFTAEELITKRPQVSLAAKEALASRLAKSHILVIDFSIINFDFSPVFTEAIEVKVKEQQEVETAKQKLAKTKVEAETAKAKAQGEADAQAALRNTGALSPEYLEYLALTKWNGVLPTVVGGATPFIDVAGFSKGQ